MEYVRYHQVPQRVAQKAQDLYWHLAPYKLDYNNNNYYYFSLKNKIQFQSNKVCYKVSLRENFQQQSCNRPIAIPLSDGRY